MSFVLSKDEYEKDPQWWDFHYPFLSFIHAQTYKILKDDYTDITVNRVFDYSNSQRFPILSIVIPVFGRKNHLKQSATCLKDQVKKLELDKRYDDFKVLITVAEMSEKPEHEKFCKKNNLEYIHINGKGHFNKSYIMNVAANAFPAETFLFFDVDLVTDDAWLVRCVETIFGLNEMGSSCWVCQPIEERKIYYVEEHLTESIFKGKKKVTDLVKQSSGLYVQPSWYDGNYPPGGAIMVSSNLLYAVQGYDPAFFSGYSPEDDFFLKRCLNYSDTGELVTWSKNENYQSSMYHLYHEDSTNSNPSYEHMILVSQVISNEDHRKPGTSIMSWYSGDKVKWQYMGLESFQWLPYGKERFTSDMVGFLRSAFGNTSLRGEELVVSAVEELRKRYPDLETYNPALFKCHVQYIRYVANSPGSYHDLIVAEQ